MSAESLAGGPIDPGETESSPGRENSPGSSDDYDDALIAALDHPEPTTPVRAAWILGERRTAKAVEPLRAVLRRSTDPFLLEAACMALGQIGAKEAEAELIAIVRDGPFLARRTAAIALGSLGTPAAIAELQHVAQFDPSERVRSAASTIGESGSRRC